MRIRLAFPTFLKFIALSPKARQSELRKRTSSEGGYNFWSPLARYAAAATSPSQNIEEICGRVGATYNVVQAKYNNAALRSLNSTLPGLGRSFVPLLNNVVPLGRTHFDVRLRPEVGFAAGSQVHLVQIWSTSRPKLTVPDFQTGLAFIKRAKEELGIEDQISIFDALSRRLYREAELDGSAGMRLDSALLAMEDDWESVFGRMPPPPPPPAHPSS